jgi:hypothetical protein
MQVQIDEKNVATTLVQRSHRVERDRGLADTPFWLFTARMTGYFTSFRVSGPPVIPASH